MNVSKIRMDCANHGKLQIFQVRVLNLFFSTTIASKNLKVFYPKVRELDSPLCVISCPYVIFILKSPYLKKHTQLSAQRQYQNKILSMCTMVMNTLYNQLQPNTIQIIYMIFI